MTNDIKTVLTDNQIEEITHTSIKNCWDEIDLARAIERAVLAASAPAQEPVVEDGENQAIRMFLMRHAGSDAVTTKQMREHLTMAGYEGCWPDWANEDQHLTKAGAQSWIRYLISLEGNVLQALTEETEKLGLYAAPVDAQDAVDAKRYRWLRDARADDKRATLFSDWPHMWTVGKEMDFAIDAALQASQSPVQDSDAGRQG